jgi:hypothetical protein
MDPFRVPPFGDKEFDHHELPSRTPAIVCLLHEPSFAWCLSRLNIARYRLNIARYANDIMSSSWHMTSCYTMHVSVTLSLCL